MIPNIQNMETPNGKAAPNQFIIIEKGGGLLGNFKQRRTFKSYNSIICVETVWADKTIVELDEDKWNFSNTTSKYRSLFLGEDTKTTKKKIKDGIYKLTKLN